MINIETKYILKVITLSVCLVLIKYIVSYYYYPHESLFFKIISLGEKDFTLYSFIVDSLSRLDLYTDWNEVEKAKGIIGFPIFSLIWHSIFYVFFGHYSFLILEIFFYSLLIILIYKVIFLLNKNYDQSIIITFLLFLFLEFLILASLTIDVNFIKVVKLPIYEFLIYRFPRPLITSTYLFAFIYFLISFDLEKNNKVTLKYSLVFGTLFFLLINSFFFIFITSFISIFIYLVLRFREKIFSFIYQNIAQILLSLSIIILGLAVFITQLIFTEPDYPNRIGTYAINLKEKIVLFNLFFKKIFQWEILTLIFTSAFIRFDNKFLNFKEIKNSRYDILLIFFFSSVLSPFIFLIFADKAIALYQFWTTVKFFGFLYIFICVAQFFLINFKKEILKKFVNLFLVVLISLNFSNNLLKQEKLLKQGKIDNQLIVDREDVRKYLIDNNNNNKNKLFYSDLPRFTHVWLELGNKNFINPYGFVVSQTDEQFENIKLNMMKIFMVENDDFLKMLNKDEENIVGRNIFAHSFTYKYTVNSLRYYKPLELEYSISMQKRIKNIPPIIWWYTFFPNSEKERLMKKYKNFKINENLIPEIFIIYNSERNDKFKNNISKYKLTEVFKNTNYTILVRDYNKLN